MTRRMVKSVAFLFTILSASACASGTTGSGASASSASGGDASGVRSAATNKFSYGYLIPRPSLAAALSVGATDTVAELPARSTMPSVVVNAIADEMAGGKWDNTRTRRVGAPNAYVVLFHRARNSSLGTDANSIVGVGFSPDAKSVGRVQWAGPYTVRLL